MAKIKLFTYNILEDNAVTVTGTADSGYPETRLYDRSIGFYWKYTASTTITIHVDQGATGNLPVDALIIDKHNFNGRSMTWEYSDNDSSWTPAVTGWTQGDNNQIVKTLDTALTHRYWRVTIVSAVNPQCTEVFMSGGYEFQVRFDVNPEVVDLDNVVWEESVGGVESANKMGEARALLEYGLFQDDVVNSALTNFRTAMSYLDAYSKPFYIKDHEDNYLFCRLDEISKATFVTQSSVERTIRLKEMLG